MADTSVSDFALSINEQVDTHEEISAKLSQIKAMVHILQKTKTDECPEYMVQCYMWALEGIVERVAELNEGCLKELMKNKHMVGQDAYIS